MSIPQDPQTYPLPRWKIETIGGWAQYLKKSRPTIYKALHEGRFLVRATDVYYQPAPRGKPRRG